MADFKDEISPELVERLGVILDTASEDFSLDAWRAAALDGLEDLELMDRVRHLAGSLATYLPQDFSGVVQCLDTALADEDFHGWMVLPCCQLVADRGLDHPDLALPLLARLSPRMSSEFAIRPFIERHPAAAFRHLREWTSHPDEHVRRLVSEGTRPRLPWAGRLPDLIDDPGPAVELLDALFDDESEYVRRSVANHLNDISKDHPELAVEVARRWLPASTRGDWVVRHGLRSLVKQGDPAALATLGFDPDTQVSATAFSVEPAEIAIGGTVTIEADLVAAAPTRAAVDYVVHHQGAGGVRSPKVFKLKVLDLGPEANRIEKRHTFRNLSIRTIHPGPHRIQLQVNGTIVAEGTVEISG